MRINNSSHIKKYLFGLILIVNIVLFSLTGCIDKRNNTPSKKNLFLGQWDGEVGGKNLTYIFYENNTYKYIIGPSDILGSWHLTDDQLNLSIRGNSELFDYSFSDDYNSLTLDPVKFNFSYTLKKQ